MFLSPISYKRKVQQNYKKQQTNQDQKLDQLLLSAQRQNIIEYKNNQDDTFELYITPCSNKLKNSDKKYNFDQTTYNNTLKKQQTILKQTNLCSQFKDDQIHRLKKIIQKKNLIIGRLTQQLRQLSYQIQNIDNKMKNSDQQWNMPHKKQIKFLQKNNLQLYQQFIHQKNINLQLNKQIKNIKEILAQKINQQNKLKQQNQKLKALNKKIIQSSKEYLYQSKKQIKYVNKMRQILAIKTGLKSENIPLGASLKKNDFKTQKSQSLLNENNIFLNKQTKSLSKTKKY